MSDKDHSQFFQALADTYAVEVEDRTASRRVCRFGDQVAEIVYIDATMEQRLGRAIEQLEISGSDVDVGLTIYLLDGQTTRSTMPKPPWAAGDWMKQGRQEGWTSERFELMLDLGPRMLYALDREARVAYIWASDAMSIPYYVCGSPLLVVLNWWLESVGVQLAHAASVALDSRALLLVGRGGSGKSTLAVTSLESDLRYLGDDYVLIKPGDEPTVYNLYQTGKLEKDHMQRLLPDYVAKATNMDKPDEEKAVFYANDHWPGKIIDEARLVGIGLPSVGHPDYSFSEMPGGALLRHLGPSTVFQLPGTTKAKFSMMAGLVRALPTFDIHVSTEVSQGPGLLKRLLESVQ